MRKSEQKNSNILLTKSSLLKWSKRHLRIRTPDCQNRTTSCQNKKINKNYESKSKTEIKKSLGFFEVFHEFERCNSRLHDWTESTFKKYKTLRNNLIDMRDYKRNAGLKFFDFTFDYFDEYGLQDFIDFLRDNKNYMNSSVTKNLSLIKVVLRWAYNMRYHNNRAFETFKPNLKSVKNRVIFLNMEEIKQLEDYHIPESKSHLTHTRDVFLFMCFTGLRYSDVANLRKYDIQENHIEVTTIKTIDALLIVQSSSRCYNS